MKKPVQEYNVSALRKSIQVLQVVRDSPESLGVSEIARRAKVSKNMCLRILETLTDLGWVSQNPQGPSYDLTLAPYQFFAGSRNRTTLLDQALGPLKQLNRQTGESVYLAALHDTRAMIIHVIKGLQPISVIGEVGSMYDLHATAPGKVFLAWGDEALRRKVFARKLKGHTPKTLVSVQDVKAELAKIRDGGYAVNLEEYGPGLLGLAAPVFDENREVIAAIGVFAPVANIPAEKLVSRYAGPVKQAAQAASTGS